jgi:pimeloyl-ACP methyl ester carboxylesterase
MQYFNSFDGLKLAYRDQGAGLPVLCLAGLTRDMTDFDYLAPHLDGVRLIAMDYRGRGASAWADDPMTYNIPTEGRDALALLDHLGLERAAIIGTSRGGLVAMMLAASAHDRLSGVCLVDIGPVIEEGAIERIKDYLGHNPKFSSRAEMAAALPAALPGFVNVPPERWLREVENHTLETDHGLTINYDPKLRDAVLATGAQPAPDLWPLYDALAGLPLALIRGVNSDLLSRETAQEMRRRRPDMVFAQVPDRGHVPFLDEAPALAAIRDWLAKCR